MQENQWQLKDVTESIKFPFVSSPPTSMMTKSIGNTQKLQ
jgi:hypothetical protein